MDRTRKAAKTTVFLCSCTFLMLLLPLSSFLLNLHTVVVDKEMSPRQFLPQAILVANLHYAHVLHVLANLHTGHVLTNSHEGPVLHFRLVKYVFSGACKMSSHLSVPLL